jgi:predicted small lipoprotein YifL
MQELIVEKSPRTGIVRRVMVAVLALAAVLTLGACKATGGGYLPPQGLFPGRANFGFNFTCEVDTAKKRAVVRGTVTYHDDPSPGFPKGVKLHGTVDPFFIEDVVIPPDVNPTGPITCAEADVSLGLEGLGYARFAGKYRSQDTTLPAPIKPGRFQVDVQDMGEPPPSLEGDSFDILLTGGEYPAYNRFGFIEGGNIQVEDD